MLPNLARPGITVCEKTVLKAAASAEREVGQNHADGLGGNNELEDDVARASVVAPRPNIADAGRIIRT